MKRLKEKRITVTLNLADLLDRLFVQGHVLEKFLVLLSVGVSGLVIGIFIGRLSAPSIMDTSAIIQKSDEETPTVSSAKLAPSSSQSNEFASETDDNTKAARAVASQDDHFFFSIRIASADYSNEAKEVAKKYNEVCGTTIIRYSPVHQKHLVYCGRFDDLVAASKVTAELKDVRQVLVRLYPE